MNVSDKTIAWCVQRGHPWVTYSPWTDATFCRCREKREPGESPIDMQALADAEADEAA